MVKVSWKPKAEPMDNIDFARDYPELIADYQAKREALGHIRLGKDAGHRKDAAKINLQRQGHWIDLQDKVSPALLHEPELGQFIDINSLDVVNPDHDITAPGNCIIRIRENDKSEDGRQLAYVYSPSGKCAAQLRLQGCFSCIKLSSTPARTEATYMSNTTILPLSKLS